MTNRREALADGRIELAQRHVAGKKKKPTRIKVVDRREVYGWLDAEEFRLAVAGHGKELLAERLGISRQAFDHWFNRGTVGAVRLGEAVEIMRSSLKNCGFVPDQEAIQRKKRILTMLES